MGHFLFYFCNLHGFYKEYKAGVLQPGVQLSEVTPLLKQPVQFPVPVTTAEVSQPAEHSPMVSLHEPCRTHATPLWAHQLGHSSTRHFCPSVSTHGPSKSVGKRWQLTAFMENLARHRGPTKRYTQFKCHRHFRMGRGCFKWAYSKWGFPSHSQRDQKAHNKQNAPTSSEKIQSNVPLERPHCVLPPCADGTRSLLGAAAHRLDVLRLAESSLALLFTPKMTFEYNRLAKNFSPNNTEKTQQLSEHLK